MNLFDVNSIELTCKEYRKMVDKYIDDIITAIMNGEFPVMNGKNVLSDIPPDVMYPLLEDIKHLPKANMRWIKKVQKKHPHHAISKYHFEFEVVEQGGISGRGTIKMTCSYRS